MDIRCIPLIIFSASVQAYYFNFSIILIFHFNLKYFKLIKSLGSHTYGINISIVRDIIIKTINRPYIKGITYVGVNNL
jgi:hypothetical protein